MFNFVQDQGRRSASGGLTTGIHGVFRGLKFEPVEAKRRSRSSGTQILGKMGRFKISSTETCFYQQTINNRNTSGHIGREF